MSKIAELVLTPEEAFNQELFAKTLDARFGRRGNQRFRIVKRSIDARSRNVVVRIAGEWVDSDGPLYTRLAGPFCDVSRGKKVVIVGAGPAGLFAGLRLVELGMRPIILDRGKDVRARRKDLAAINKEHVVNPDSNYCFGEGGAGTYSDGKLYTRSKKRGDILRILELFCLHGVREEIMYDAHPHIGTNKLPVIVSAISKTITDCGGEIHFDSRVDDLVISGNRVEGVRTPSGEYLGWATILATGHSARDIYRLLHQKKIIVEAKPFALGVRVEHRQDFIDKVQYHCATDRGPYLPAASYSLVHQAKLDGRERGVFSFCMCPGGFIVPSATTAGEVVVNGMSPSRRDSRFANSGIVVSVDDRDFAPFQSAGALAGLEYQAHVEQKACLKNTQDAPAQLLEDFVNGKVSSSLNETSYQPGLISTDLHSVLPKTVTNALVQGFKAFGNKMKGYLSNDAQILGVESRTSSPVRIPRNDDTLVHVQLDNLYPCGEGAGYAGGIMSAAMDGERVAESIAKRFLDR